MALVEKEMTGKIEVEVRGRKLAAEETAMPFYIRRKN
jgi:hypothetical protein